MSLKVIHASLASVTAAAGFALVVSAGWATYRRSASSIRLVLLVRRAAIIAALLAGAAGVLLLVTGHRPHALLHVMYGVFALLTVPFAATLAARNPQRGGVYHLVAGILLLGLAFRLAATG
ncbi:MAG: hypothetical protein ACR2MY_09235 [Candidatus Dormibacteria bacterium]